MTIRGVLTLLLTSTMTLATNAQNEVMTPEKLWELQRVSLAGVSPDGSTVLYNITQYDIAANQGTTRIAACNLSGEQRQLTDGTQSAQAIGFTPSGRIAYLQQGQLWTMTPTGQDARQATHIEGGIENVLFSPKGDAVLFTRQVKYRPTTAELYPELPKANARIIDDLMYRHWNTWEDDKVSHVFYAPFNGTEVSGEGTDIMAGQPYDSPLTPFGGAEQLAWSPDGLKIAYTCKKKQGTAAAISTDADIYLYDIVSGKTENLTQGNGGYDTNPAWSPDGRFLAWLSMDEDGYEADKNDIKILEWTTGRTYNLTERWDETVEAFAWEKNSLSLVFRTAFNGVAQLFEYSLPKDLSQLAPNQDITQLTKEKTCTGAFIPTGKYIIAERYDFNRPNELVAYDLKRKTIRPLTDVNGPAMQSIAPSPVQARWVTTTAGRQMLVWMVFPPHFDPAKKYPALLFCGGGPQSPLTPDYSFRWNFQLMAAKGYVVVIPNRRGLPGFGVKWNEEVSGAWGGQAITDLLTAIDDVAREPYIDRERLGAVGASYGGYSVYMLAGKHQGRFKTFIAHCGTFDMKSWYGTTEEIFFANKDLGGAYWQNKANPSYNEYSPSSYVDLWDTPILILQGEQDFRVPLGQSMQAFQAARLRGIEARMVLFPDECHWILRPQDALLWQAEFFSWLDKYLAPES